MSSSGTERPDGTPAADGTGFSQNPYARKGPARVHIYGGGIAGLTAAHELALRGFRVRVIEPAQECDETGRLEGAPEPLDNRMAVGGLARTQFLRVERGAPGNFEWEEGGTSPESRLFLDYPEDFEPGEGPDLLPTPARGRLATFLYKCGFFSRRLAIGVLHIRIPPSAEPQRQRRRRRNAEALHDFLTGGNTWGLNVDPAKVVILEEAEALELTPLLTFPPLPLEDKEGLQVELLHFLPGEHGFRFFPSYYRNLFATLLEIPLLDAQGNLTGRWVYDNLKPSSFYGIAAQGRRIRFLRRRPPTRPAEVLEELRDVAASGYPPSDTLQFTLRIWRYMCTCSERRKAEYEGISWLQYLEGYDPKTKLNRYQYSEAFQHDMQFAPRVLAAFDGKWGDARTNGNTLVQLYLNNLLPLPMPDGTLNGPTTTAWFRPWRTFLRDFLKVEFHAGELTRITLDARNKLWPYWRKRGESEEKDDTTVDEPPIVIPSAGEREKVDYHLVATDAWTAERVTQGLPRIGVVHGLYGFTTKVPTIPGDAGSEQDRPEGALPGYVPWDRFQTLTGIQFFFPSSVRLAEGYLYFLDAPWGLSAISSHQYWATPPTYDRDGFGAVLSVDIGNWYVREPGLKSPSRSSRHEIAHEVWKQIREATELHHAPLPEAAGYAFTLPEPAWYHLDRFIEFKWDRAARKKLPSRNQAPYLIPFMGEWDRRPGAEPWNPLVPDAPSAPDEALPDGLWRAPHGGYQVHWDKLVFAGTYLKTFTRMTTMEAANESARHAVNAIIDHYLAHHAPPAEAPSRAGGPSRVIAEPGGEILSSPEFRMTPIGEYCRVWDPEQHELAELAPLRALDAKLFAAGLPHVWDVLHLEPLALPLIPPLDAQKGLESLREFLRQVREGLEALLKAAGVSDEHLRD